MTEHEVILILCACMVILALVLYRLDRENDQLRGENKLLRGEIKRLRAALEAQKSV